MVSLNKKFLREFIFVQKCVPFKILVAICSFRNIVFNINTKKYWDEKWKAEKKDLPQHRFHQVVFEKIFSLVPYKSKVIDIGCGLGILMEKLKKEKECKTLGMDISKLALCAIQEKGMEVICARVPPIPLQSNSFDIAIAAELIEHINNPPIFLNEMVRILKPNGSLIIALPCDALAPNLVREHTRIFNERGLAALITKIKDISNTEIFKLKESNESFSRLVIMCRKK